MRVRKVIVVILIVITISFVISKVAFATNIKETTIISSGTMTATVEQTEIIAVETTTATTTETTTVAATEATAVGTTTASGSSLNSEIGTVKGPSGKETFYNLNMSGVISIMRDLGYDYEYWIREDGVKMFGDYVMCAANLELRPRGTLVETSLGTAIVCDTGDFAEENPKQLDIAVAW